MGASPSLTTASKVELPTHPCVRSCAVFVPWKPSALSAGLRGKGETGILQKNRQDDLRARTHSSGRPEPKGRVMRTAADRIRHAIAFELSALVIVSSLGVFFSDRSSGDIGAIAVVGSLIAAVWVYGYNYLFDLALLQVQGRTQKSLVQRVVHALLFETSLLLLMLPIIAWHLQLTLTEAFLMDAAFAAFYIVYAFCFNWLYDYQFPVEDESASSTGLALGSACPA